ncbi:putative apolipoprotein C-I [Kosakonia phage Kc263]|uniref:Apolipoprotein C-I n=1 Tax=Kosakonia phage Kc263 TaxID=2863194 RepID=A0AAE7WI21_9CAUD|nr:putative apolipoprotein C-I [Kosakonia phage Kc263]QYN80029.1 putative apolipoprotein C-I [Kosakonia phage Kc263]
MNVTSAFVRGSSGSLTDSSASALNNYMTNLYQKYDNLTGWLGETLESVKEAHKTFMNSRMWEFSNRINGKDGQFVGRFEIGYLSEVQYQQQATGFMRDYIMANPLLMDLYQQDRVSGYDGDFNELCSGIERENYFYNRAIDGKVIYDQEENTLNRTIFNSSRDTLSHLSFSERVDIHRTWQATNLHIAKNLFDPTSTINGNILSVEEVEELRKKAQEESDQ